MEEEEVLQVQIPLQPMMKNLMDLKNCLPWEELHTGTEEKYEEKTTAETNHYKFSANLSFSTPLHCSAVDRDQQFSIAWKLFMLQL